MFIELQVQHMKIPSSEHVVNINCSVCKNNNKKQFVYRTCSELGISMCSPHNSMNNLLSNCELVDTKIRASGKDLPVQIITAFSYANINGVQISTLVWILNAMAFSLQSEKCLLRVDVRISNTIEINWIHIKNSALIL